MDVSNVDQLISLISQYYEVEHDYEIIRQSDVPDEEMFKVTLVIGNETYTAVGSTEQYAKHRAALKAIELAQYKTKCCTPQSVESNRLKNAISVLYEKRDKFRFILDFNDVVITGVPDNKLFFVECVVKMNMLKSAHCEKLEANKYKAVGSGFTKKDAKLHAAQKMLEKLKLNPTDWSDIDRPGTSCQLESISELATKTTATKVISQDITSQSIAPTVSKLTTKETAIEVVPQYIIPPSVLRKLIRKTVPKRSRKTINPQPLLNQLEQILNAVKHLYNCVKFLHITTEFTVLSIMMEVSYVAKLRIVFPNNAFRSRVFSGSGPAKHIAKAKAATKVLKLLWVRGLIDISIDLRKSYDWENVKAKITINSDLSAGH